jgi:uncharacterized small protein (DUF1192 family)
VSALPDELKRAKQQTNLKFNQMQTEHVTPIDERNAILQDVIDRLLYLSPDEMAKYKETLSLMHRVYSIKVKEINGVRIYSATKNQK